MEERTVTHSTFVIERSYPTALERVFAAFADPVRKRRWFVEGHNMGVEGHELDFQVGGRERTSYRFPEGSPFPGAVMRNDTMYMDIVPNRRIVMSYTMAIGDRRISASLATIELQPNGSGTNLTFTEQGAFFEGSDGAQRREDGWSKLLDKLAGEMTR